MMDPTLRDSLMLSTPFKKEPLRPEINTETSDLSPLVHHHSQAPETKRSAFKTSSWLNRTASFNRDMLGKHYYISLFTLLNTIIYDREDKACERIVPNKTWTEQVTGLLG